nr:hypothetical protein [Tanacetum cinerariifolium]
MDIEIKQDDLNKKFLTSLAPEWLLHTIVWRNRSDLDTMSLDDLYNHLKVYEPEVQNKSELNSHNMAFISSAKNNSGNGEVNTADIPTASTQVSPTGSNVATASISLDTACTYIASQYNGEKISIQGSAGHPEAKKGVEGKTTDKEENHALVADEEAPIEFTLMAKSSTDNEVFDNSLCSKACKKNTDSLNSKITELSEKLSDTKNMLYHYKLGGLELKDEFKTNRIECLTNELETLKKEKEGLDSKLTGLPEFEDDTITDYSRPSPAIETERPTETKTDKVETVKKPSVKYAEMYKKTSKRSNVRGKSQVNIDDKGYWDSGWSRHITGNISYLSDYEPFDRGYVSFGQGGCKITRKGTIKTGKLEFENVYFVKDLKTPRQHNMYSIDINNVVPHKDLTCLVAKAFADECMLWHRRLGHLNIKTMNRLVRHNLVRGLPSKYFDNDHTCVACLKGKQHKASCKTKLVNSVTKPLHTLHNLFGPTFVSSLNHKWYCLVVTDDFSRFTWTFFLKSKDETSGILSNFISEIENMKDLKVKIIRCDNGGKFEAKGDEGYFIGYSMSSKAFRVFNKRTKRVEENLHVNFLKNKAIEKGAGPNWLFDIYSLTNSMNYVPVVVAVQTSGSGFSNLLAVATTFTGSGNLYYQWELLTWQWECLMHFILNNPLLNLMLLLHSSFPE